MTLNKTVLSKDQIEIEKVIQTTPSQMEIWLACKLGGKEANMAYNESVSIHLNGNLCMKSLQYAFCKLIERHEGMRALVSANGKNLIIYSPYELPIRFRDISDLPCDEKQRFLAKHSVETGRYQFNLVQGPLYVLELIKLDGLHHQLTFTGHHIVFDGWSLGVMLEELGEIYSAVLDGGRESIQSSEKLSEYVKDFINITRKASYRLTKNYWTNYLGNPVPEMELPIDKERPKQRTYDASVLECPLEPSVMASVKELAVRSNTSLNLTLLSIFEVFLSKWSGQKETLVGLPVAGQIALNRMRLIGHCVHLLPQRSQIDGSITFIQYLANRKKAYNNSLDHQMISFGDMIKDLPIKRDISRATLVPLTFNIDLGMDNKISFKGLEHKLVSNPKSYANFEIILNLFGSGDDVHFEWTYNKNLFTEKTIGLAAKKYNDFLKLLSKSPNISIDDLIAISKEEDIKGADHIEMPLTSGTPIQKLIADAAQAQEEKPALVFKDIVLTYRELADKANSVTRYLIEKGVKPGDIVGVNLDRSQNLAIAILGIIGSGAAYLPIDADFPLDRVRFMLSDAAVKCFFSDRQDADWGDVSDRLLPAVSEIDSDLGEHIYVNGGPSDPAVIIYTSGSTGKPKGVVLTFRNLSYFTDHFMIAPGLTVRDKVLGITSISFDMAILEFVMPYVKGATVYLLDKYQRRDPREILRFLRSYEITRIFGTPSHLKAIVENGWKERFSKLSVISAGEPLPLGLAHTLKSISKELWNVYGPSETTIFSTIKRIEDTPSEITIGKAVANTEVLIVDGEGNLVAEPGKLGEIYIGGTGVGVGYLNRNELTREKFIVNPFQNKPGRYYKTGDLGQWTASGEILCKGRIDHQVKIRGQRVELGEIESRILLDKLVSNTVVNKVIGVNGEDLLVAYVSLVKKFANEDELTDWIESCKNELGKVLSSYMVPSQFIMVDEFKLNSNGKIDRGALKPILPVTVPIRESVDETTLSATEIKVKRIWEEVLKLSKVGITEDFFQMGGHSLLAVELISLVEKEFKVDLPLSILFEYPTVKSLAGQMDTLSQRDGRSSVSCLSKIKDGAPDKVLYFIHGVGLNPIEIKTLVKSLDQDQTIWGLQSPAVLNSSIAPLESLEDIAGYYIGEIRKEGLKGPFNLMGNSFGGLIAFEMAKQLLHEGEKVTFLGMIDTIASHTEDENRTTINKIGSFFGKLSFEFSFFLDDPGYYFDYRRKYLLEKKESIRNKFEKIDTIDLNQRIKQIERTNQLAWKKYKHEPIDVKITLFQADRRTFFVEDFNTFGWSKFAKEVEIIKMPGEHANMLKPPHGVEFTRTLQKKLNSSKI